MERSHKIYKAEQETIQERWLTNRVIVGELFGLRFGFFGAETAARCRFIFVDYFLVVERCNRTVKPEREKSEQQ